MRPYFEAMAVTPPQLEDLDRWTEQALERGATALVLRLIHPPLLSKLWEWARRWAGVPWIAHARWASQCIGWGLHFPAPATPPGPKPDLSYLYGQSCHTPEEVRQAATWASYVWVGPFFPTPSHPDQRRFFPLEELQEVVQAYPDLPVVAIGGLDTPERIQTVLQAGAKGFAAIRYFLG